MPPAVVPAASAPGAPGPLAADTTPPLLSLYPLPSLTDEDTVDVRGTVSDASPCNVTVNGLWALGSSTGFFLVRVPLVPGNNTITARAVDQAGNEAVALAAVEFVPPERWFVHPEKHFRIPVPYGWHGYANFTQDGVPVDLFMYTSGMDVNLVVVSESRTLQGTPAEARGILREATDDLARWPGFAFLAAPFDRTVDGHVAATAFVTWQPPGEVVDQIITIVLGPEYGMLWAIIGTTTPANVTEAGPLVKRTTAAFDVLAPPSFDLTRWQPEMLAAASVATTAEGAFVAVQVLRARRRRMPWDRAYL